MPAVTRVGDNNTGHDACPPTALSSGSPNVNINGIPAGRVGDPYNPHGCPAHVPHVGNIVAGAPHVFINGKAAGRIGDPVSCGGSVAAGSSNVFIGNGGGELVGNAIGANAVKTAFWDNSNETDKTILSMPEICQAMADKTDDPDKQGWVYLKQMFEKWLRGDALSAGSSSLDYSKAMFLSFDWFNQFERFVEVKQDLIDNCLNDKGQASLIKILKENGYFDNPREFDFINVSYKERERYYFNHRPVKELDASLDPIDGLSIAMGAFTINATAKGKVEKQSDENFLITVEQIGLYVKDTFNFVGKNLYFYWSYKDKDFSTYKIYNNNYCWLTNKSFNQFRENANKGEDFLIFSDVEKESISTKIIYSKEQNY